MLKAVFVCLIMLLLNGCVGIKVPDVPDYSFMPTDKIGLIVFANSSGPTHTHVGTTIFNNYTNNYNIDWDIQAAITEHFIEGVEHIAPIEVVNLSQQMDRYSGLVTITDDKWQLSLIKQAEVNQLLDDGIKAVVSITEIPKVLVASECSAFGCTERYANGYGLFSRGMIGFDTFMKVNSFAVNVELLEPPADLARAGLFKEYNDNKISPIDGDDEPQKNSDIQPDEWAFVKTLILEDFTHLGESVGNQLLGNTPAVE